MTAMTLPRLLSWTVDGDPDNFTAIARQHRHHLAELRRDQVRRPTLFVGAGTCGLGAGARETLAAIHDYLHSHEINANVVMVGCIGLCSLEPIVNVQLPDRPRVSYRQITADKVAGLLAAALAAPGPAGWILGQHRNAAIAPWPDVPMLDEHPFFAPQTRWVLANCGIIDPSQIDEYIARGGYQALVRMLRGMTPEAVCDLVERSGLRGRGGGGFPAGKKWKFARQAPGAEIPDLQCRRRRSGRVSWTGPSSRAIPTGSSRAWRSPPTASGPPKPTSISGPNTPWRSSG